MGLIAPPIAFQAEWPPFMYFASKPASRSMMAVLQPKLDNAMKFGVAVLTEDEWFKIVGRPR
jgi:hypothetical protein